MQRYDGRIAVVTGASSGIGRQVAVDLAARGATVVGLAFRMFDPERLLGDKTDYGITCALIPHDVPGIEIGRRHFPLNIPFQNGPVRGQDVFVPIDCIIGGLKMAGRLQRRRCLCGPGCDRKGGASEENRRQHAAGDAYVVHRALLMFQMVREQSLM